MRRSAVVSVPPHDSSRVVRRLELLIAATLTLATGFIVSEAAGVSVAGALSPSASPVQGPLSALDQQDAVASYAALESHLFMPAVFLYQGLSGSSCGSYSCLWPFTNAMAATVYLDRSPAGSRYLTDIVARQVGLADYTDLLERSPTGAVQPSVFQSAVAPPLGPGGATYYDDNAWVGLDLLDAYRATADPADLVAAQNEFAFATSGWDTSTTDGCPGGVFWEDVAGSQRNTSANAANAELGLELNLLTANTSDLSWATRLYQWVVTCLGTPNGLYDDHVNPGGSINTTIWSYNQGVMIGAGTLLFRATGDMGYLDQANRTAAAALAYFGTGSTLVAQGPAFNAIYFRDLLFLDQVSPNPAYAEAAQTYATYMWSQRQASTGLIDPDLGVNGTAPMVELYSILAGSSATP
jgi:hypothetical protein